ncbi:hypothetical protein HBI57_065700 [Parastagonospora nodorum]|nr:hypothetical protein HBI57_065700 [Parastagonospora nodorum]
MEKKAHVTMLRLERHGVSRRALIAFILITQILVLASTNFAAYTWGITRLVEILASAPRMSNSNSFSGPQVRTQPKFLELNEAYAERPSPATDAAWEAIFPPHGGFFKDSEIAPTGASLAVYHQLHCLDAIRNAYYVLFDAVQGGYKVTILRICILNLLIRNWVALQDLEMEESISVLFGTIGICGILKIKLNGL